MAISPDPHSQVARLATLTPGASAWMFGATIHPGDGRTDSDIEMLQRLHPSAMAHVLDMSPRAFRDRVDIPRNPDGTCNARDVTRALRDDAEEHFVTRLVRDGHYGAVVGLDAVTSLLAGLEKAVDGLPPRPSKTRVVHEIGNYLTGFFEPETQGISTPVE